MKFSEEEAVNLFILCLHCIKHNRMLVYAWDSQPVVMFYIIKVIMTVVSISCKSRGYSKLERNL